MDFNQGKGSGGEGPVHSATATASERYRNPDPLVRKEAVRSVYGCCDRETILFLTLALRDEDKEVRNESILGLAKVGTFAVDALAPLLHDPEWRIRYRAVEGLGMIGDRSSARLLIPLTSDEKDHVRYMAAKALGTLSPHDSADALALLIRDENPYVRRIAADGLGRSGRSDLLPLLAEACARESDREARLTMERSMHLLDTIGGSEHGG